MKSYRIKTILVPTDFSTIAQYAMQHAERLAALTRARIVLLHVIEPLGYAFGTSGMLGVASAFERKQAETSRSQIQKISRVLEKRSGVRVLPRIIKGRVAPLIIRVAIQVGADLVIMGTHGASGFVENLLGSNTYRVASISQIPLMSVHRKIGKQGYDRIIFPVREEQQGLMKLPYTVTFARLFGAPVHIIGTLVQGHGEQERRMRAACARLEKAFAKNGVAAEASFAMGGFLPEIAIRHGRQYPHALVVVAQEKDFHLVEVFQGSFSKNVLHKHLSPVLCIPGR